MAAATSPGITAGMHELVEDLQCPVDFDRPVRSRFPERFIAGDEHGIQLHVRKEHRTVVEVRFAAHFEAFSLIPLMDGFSP